MMSKRALFLVILVCFAMNACRTNATRTARPSGSAGEQNRQIPAGPYTLTFSKTSYGAADTLKSTLVNNTDSAMVIALRCGHYLELSWQQSVNEQWSDNKQPKYMQLRCATHTYTINPHSRYDFSLPASQFGATGNFRLLISFTAGTGNTSETLTSAPFEIR